MKSCLKMDDEKALESTAEFYMKGVFPAYPYPKPENFKDAQQVIGEDNPKVKAFDVNTILDSSFMKSAEDRGVAKT